MSSINDVDPATAAATAKDAAALGSKSLAVVADVAKSADIAQHGRHRHQGARPHRHPGQQRHEDRAGQTGALPEAAWDTTMNIGLKGAFLVSQAAPST